MLTLVLTILVAFLSYVVLAAYQNRKLVAHLRQQHKVRDLELQCNGKMY
jgi:cell division protein FtsL